MAKLLKLRRGTTTQHSSFTGAEGEVTVDTDKETLVVHDGSTAGGHPVAAEDMANVSSSAIAGRLSNDSIATSKLAAGALPSDVTVASANLVNGTIVNEDVNASAAIAGTKVSPDFGSQNVVTTGTLGSGDLTITSAAPKIEFYDSNANSDFRINVDGGVFQIEDITNSQADRFTIASDGTTTVAGNLDCASGVDVTGALIVSGGATESPVTVTTSNDHVGKFESTNGHARLIIEDSSSTNNANGVQVAGNTLMLKVNNEDGVKCIGDGDTILYRDGSEKIRTTAQGVSVTGLIEVSGTVDGRDIASDGSKLDGIEASATADQTAAEIRSLVESASDSNVFTDADHTKLNGIEASATADQTAAEIRTLVESASDSNVFTDADHSKLNGIEASATADQTGAEIASALNGQDIYTTGNIGRDNTDYFSFTNNTRLDLYINGSNEFRFENDGDFHADGDVIAFSTTTASDRRLKENIEVIPNALDKVQALTGVSFDWKKTGEKSAGVIAQEVQGVLPEAVKEVTPIGGGDSHLAVNYHALTSILIESIKELKAEIEQLKGGQ